MAPGPDDKKAERSYLGSAVDSVNPWLGGRPTSRGPNLHPVDNVPTASLTPSAAPDDHSTTHLYGQSARIYPSDCPPLQVQWFHAVDVPKRKPQHTTKKSSASSGTGAKPPVQPKKFCAFSASDSKAIECAYQKILESVEDHRSQDIEEIDLPSPTPINAPNTSMGMKHDFVADRTNTRVPVNEDFLFDVDIRGRELAPAYWLGPVYEVRRGTWFFQEGSALRPCEENLAAQLEEGYLKLKPWLHPARVRSASGSRNVTPKASVENLKQSTVEPESPIRRDSHGTSKLSSPTEINSQQYSQPQAYRLFGAYMNSVATYQDSSTAWLSDDSMLSWVTSSVYEKFVGGGYMSGIKLVRGYTEPSRSKERDEKPPMPASDDIPGLDVRQQRLLKRRSAPPVTQISKAEDPKEGQPQVSTARPKESRLQRQLSSLFEGGRNSDETEAELRKMEEEEIQDDYNAQAGETQGRDIEHLVLVTHGIGQLLSLRMESVNFVHDVNVMRKTFKSVYADSADLRALNSEGETGPGNCKVQILPVCWRHMLDFPKQRAKGREHDLGDVDFEEDDYPSLDDITIEGVAFARSLVSDLALDVLLYQSSYREEISRIVLGECNRIFRLFRERNPEFRGKVHLVGHSLGSAILFDILCKQRETEASKSGNNPLRFWPSQPSRHEKKSKGQKLVFEFDVDDFYCLGSPIGLFQMLKGRTIAARHSLHTLPSESPLVPDMADDPFMTSPAAPSVDVSPVTGLPTSISSPKVKQLFNVFHPSDPISYRLEPLISPAMKSLKPQVLPYTKRGIFGAVGPQGLSGLGVKVGQSVSGLWSSFSAGIASNMLNRSLGFTSEEVARMAAEAGPAQRNISPGAGTNISSGGVIHDVAKLNEKLDERKKLLAESRKDPASSHKEDPTLIDDDLETLYSNFQKKRARVGSEGQGAKVGDDGHRARKLRMEEAKVRALNRNGRVDFSIQEGVLDFNPINTIASHMCYWADEDVNHFILSQLLSDKSGKRRSNV